MAEGPCAIQHVTLRELTPHQKREIGAILAAGVGSAAFFLVPFLPADPPPLPSAPMAVQVGVVAESPRSLTVPPLRTSARPSPTRLLTARAAHPVMMLASSSSIEVPEPQAATPKSPGRITRLLVGSGRYRVQPFPTPGEQ